MAGNENRRRKKLEAKRTKRKEKQRSIARVESSGMMARIAAAQNWPLIETRMTPDLTLHGIANVVISRRGPQGQVAAVTFLVDAECLGVKDVAIYLGSETTWRRTLLDREEEGMELVNVSPEHLRKFVEGAVAFARSFGIAPHRDYVHAAPIFGSIDPTLCSTEFVYGTCGKPRFIPGPYDSRERIRRILAILTAKAGEGNFYFDMGMFGDAIDDDFDATDDDDDELLEAIDEDEDSTAIEHRDP